MTGLKGPNHKTANGIALLLIDIQNDFIDGSLAIKEAKSILPTVQFLISLQGWQMIIASQDSHPPEHISFASTHKLPPFQTISIPHPTLGENGETVEQMLWPDHCLKGSRGSLLEKSLKESLDRKILKGVKVEILEKGFSKNHDAYSAFSYNHYLSFSSLPKILFSHPSPSPSHPSTSNPNDPDKTPTTKQEPISTLILCGLATDYCLISSAIDSIKFGFRTIVVLEGCKGVDVRGDSCQIEIKKMKDWGCEFLEVKDIEKMLMEQQGFK